MNDNRPSPDDLLKAAESPTSGGHLRVYLGMCPGVGKTYAMLEDAVRWKRENDSVLAGVIETHGREETAALAAKIPVIPARTVDYRGATIGEFDLDETLRCNPELVLVDELAHTNAPGSRHPKRWQDVEELLAAGISVWTTVNIQHVESLRDDVMAITGVRVHETVPDIFLDKSNEIRVIDITPEQLRQRLMGGKVYLGERADAAAEGFFREGNLRALREMALRFTTRKVDAEKRDFMRRNLIHGPWRAGERFLVAVGTSPHAERLIRLTSRLAKFQNADWIAVHIETGRSLDDAEYQNLAANLALARSLGGETLSHPSDDPVRGILYVARRENVTQIVAGKNTKTSFWSRIRGSIADHLQSESGNIDLLLVHPGDDRVDSARVLSTEGTPSRSVLRDVSVITGSLFIVTLLGILMETLLGYSFEAMFYVAAVPLAGLLLSRWGVVILAILGGFTWNFVFTEPRLSFHMAEHADLTQLGVMLVVALVIGHLTHRLRLREEASRTSEERARALYQLTRVISASPSFALGVRAALKQVEVLFKSRASLIAWEENQLVSLGGAELSPKQESVCQWALEHNQAAGRFTGTLPESEVLALPLTVNGRPQAALAVIPTDHQLASPVVRDLLETFAAHFSVLLEREQYLRAQQETVLLDQSRRFQRALLDHVSHEIKTPVAVIRGSVDHLTLGTPQPALIGEIREAAERLNRVMTQLIALSRVESGMIEPSFELCDPRDLMQEVAERFPSESVEISGGHFTFRTDPTLLDTVLFNLVQNAVQHGGGTAKLHAEQDAENVTFRISNSGNSIPSKDANLIFERFKRLNDAQVGGLGLGLPIARNFSGLIGGTVKLLHSNESETVFEAAFRRQDEPHSMPPILQPLSQ